MGIEPTSGGTTNLCLNHLATLAIHRKYMLLQIYVFRQVLFENSLRIFKNPVGVS